ncbi:META domain-containing protein [Thiocystis violascens]|uniref:Heat shock protein n=1 Tax=Thiocystis violascens (strain ATCC 17096 / DSM 198 / 6111) TaxID=765911 RepID=I3YBG1_THIV6|nr:META domain-containing protein [Thiocystis violascens]AFL74329.1 heat shock protein [Thiocystis violascens DSM 198]
MQQIRHPLIAPLLIAALFSSPVGAAESVIAQPSNPLEGQTWQLTSYPSADGLVGAIAKTKPALFRFTAGRIAGNAGCNQITGAYRLDGTGLTIDQNLASTMMACPEPLMRQEQAVTAALARVAAYRQVGERLELLDAANQTLLGFQAIQAAPLVGTLWRLEVFNNGKQALVSSLAGADISLEFSEQGTLGGSDGCNRYMSGFRLEGDRLTVGPIATTRMACQGPDAVAAQAAAYARALGTVAGYRIEGRQLTLLDADGKTAARFQAPAPVDPGDPVE